MEGAAVAASAAAAAARDAALAASVVAAAAAKDAAAAVVTAKEAMAAAKDAAAAALNAEKAAAKASAAALDAKDAAAAVVTAKEAMVAAKDAAATASAAALNAEKAAAKASAAALDAKEAAVVAAAAAKDAAAAVVTAKEAMVAAKDAAATASAAALNAEKAAAKASAAALDAKEAAAVAATAGEAAAAAAAGMQASKKRKFNLIEEDDQDNPPRSADVGHGDFIDDQDDPSGSGNVDDQDLISRLPDAVLSSIISLLPTKDGIRTQAISRRWRPLWRSAPLNLVADQELMISTGERSWDFISMILSEHPGPGRRFSLGNSCGDCLHKVKGWLSSQALDNLLELNLTCGAWLEQKLPSSVYRFAPTLCVANFGGFHFPNLIVQLSLKFPCLKQLTLDSVTISEDAFQSMLSGCSALESLELKKIIGFARLCIISQTLKSIGFRTGWGGESVVVKELVIEDTPCLERFLQLDQMYARPTIRVISAPKLKVLGVISKYISELHFGTTVFQKMIAVCLSTKLHTMRVLVLDSDGPNMDAVVNYLKCFPCLETLYVIFRSISYPMVMNNVREYDPLDPIECLELHLKKVVLKNYDGTKSSSIDFAKFFVLNAKLLKEMKIALRYHRQDSWFARQRTLLQIRNRASKDARFELKCGVTDYFTDNRHTHDLSMADPFDFMPFKGCSKCSRGPF